MDSSSNIHLFMPTDENTIRRSKLNLSPQLRHNLDNPTPEDLSINEDDQQNDRSTAKLRKTSINQKSGSQKNLMRLSQDQKQGPSSPTNRVPDSKKISNSVRYSQFSTSNVMKATGSNMMRSSIYDTAKSTHSKQNSKIDVVSNNNSLVSKLHHTFKQNATTLAGTSGRNNQSKQFLNQTSRNLYDRNSANLTVRDSMRGSPTRLMISPAMSARGGADRHQQASTVIKQTDALQK